MLIEFNFLIENFEKVSSFYQVIDVSKFEILFSDLIWILGRDKKISPEHRTLIYSTLDNYRIDDGRLTLSKQKDCD